MFKLDKSNQKQLWDILNELSTHEDLDDYDRAMLYEAAEVIQSFDAPERDTKEYYTLTKWTWKKNEPSYDPDFDKTDHFCSGCGESCACYCTGDSDE